MFPYFLQLSNAILYSPDIDRISFSEDGVSAYFNGQKYFDKIESPKAVEHAFRQFEQVGRIPGFSDLLSTTVCFCVPSPRPPQLCWYTYTGEDILAEAGRS